MYNKCRRREGPCIQAEMVSSVFNSASAFSLLASRNQQYKAVTAVTHHVRTSSDYYYYYYHYYCYYYHHYYYLDKIMQNKKNI